MKLSLCCVLLFTLYSVSIRAMTPAEIPQWQSVGSAKLTVFWFDIYQAELSSNNGEYDKNKSFMLTLTYLRSFESKELIDETFKQFNKPLSQKQSLEWRARLEEVWPDVKKGDQISFVKSDKGVSHFFFNKKYQGQITEPEFADLFSAIWLSDDSEYPELAAKLKGKSQ